MFAKSALLVATAAAIALTSFDLRPAQAAPQGGIAKQGNADDFSAARKRRRGVHPGVPLAAFGAIVGTIASIAAAERRREYYERHYYGGPYVYGAPQGDAGYGYAPYAGYGFGPPLAPGPVYGGHGYRAYQYRLGPPAPANDHPGY